MADIEGIRIFRVQIVGCKHQVYEMVPALMSEDQFGRTLVILDSMFDILRRSHTIDKTLPQFIILMNMQNHFPQKGQAQEEEGRLDSFHLVASGGHCPLKLIAKDGIERNAFDGHVQPHCGELELSAHGSTPSSSVPLKDSRTCTCQTSFLCPLVVIPCLIAPQLL